MLSELQLLRMYGVKVMINFISNILSASALHKNLFFFDKQPEYDSWTVHVQALLG